MPGCEKCGEKTHAGNKLCFGCWKKKRLEERKKRVRCCTRLRP